MKPLKIYFKILKVGNGKLLKNRDEVNNLIVDLINKNPSQPASGLRAIALEALNHTALGQQSLQTSDRFFISRATDIEVIITFLPEEKAIQDQFYTQWRYIQISTPYRLVQYLDENKVVVYSEKTKVLHTIKLDKDITVVVDED
ncbi:MAG: hypothetical protein P0Y49_02090 [Candidatus Pedobacter colombiensis]|uniref:Uncharacterized protein n=1 Tax=Candidatus Pedobacter colombiensis TaxID=3121371 RepID=A0AAJ5W8G1_9SPHI|nr:hypothetical protein [Pedobacter sp.]WEK19942.1 MAG: hypothetical protein P0Y49_02090 [Pedobacter sp.]